MLAKIEALKKLLQEQRTKLSKFQTTSLSDKRQDTVRHKLAALKNESDILDRLANGDNITSDEYEQLANTSTDALKNFLREYKDELQEVISDSAKLAKTGTASKLMQ